MARESSLWQRLVTGVRELAGLGWQCHVKRVENAIGTGDPDVGGCIDGGTFLIELKSCSRPARDSTVIRPKTRESQSIWHRERTAAGSRCHWVLIQVGEAHKARLYLIPGSRYDEIAATEGDLEFISKIQPTASPANVLLRAREGW